ncbi:MAG TPA: YceI family protein [Steroidobacteraceae bacterium]|nr:YceI family protein [Steroidobacteraceae bacterium]
MANYLARIALGVLLTAGSLAAEPVKPATPAASGATKYTQANSGSSLAFTFSQLGAENTGRFKTFATELTYDEANPAQGSLLVRVMIDSIDTQDGERDGTLKGADLFDAKAYPAATFVAKSLARSAGGLEAVGKLTIRGVARDLRLPLTLTPTANGLELSGQVSIKRLDYGVGQGEWKSTESVGDDVKVQYKVALVRVAK